MSKKIQSYTIDEDIVCRLEKYASTNTISKSSAVERMLTKFLNVENKLDEPVKVEEQPQQTEDSRLAEWEWRKGMVAAGKMPVQMGKEHPSQFDLDEKGVYLTPDGLPLDCKEKISSTQTLTTNTQEVII